jgi:N-acetylmuramoyl-L-alanine amidase
MRIIVDPGHFYRPGVYVTPGKRSPQIPPGIYEGEFAGEVAELVGMALFRGGHEVEYTHLNDRTKSPSLTERRRIGNTGDLFISIHANAAAGKGWQPASGFIIFCNQAGYDVAVAVAAQFKDAFSEGRLPYGPRRNPLGVVIQYVSDAMPRKIPSVLIECGMMTNQKDAEFMATHEGRIDLAQWIVGGTLAAMPSVKRAKKEKDL